MLGSPLPLTQYVDETVLAQPRTEMDELREERNKREEEKVEEEEKV